MRKLLILVTLTLATSPLVIAQTKAGRAKPITGTGKYQAIVGKEEVVFTFPITPRRQYEWYSGGLQYTWHAKIKNNNQEYEAGYYLFMPMGATPPGKGNFQQLLESGQFSVWKVKRDGSSEVVEGASVEGFANKNRDELTIKLSGEKAIQSLFSSKPQYCTLMTKLLDKEYSTRVAVEYKGGGGDAKITTPHQLKSDSSPLLLTIQSRTSLNSIGPIRVGMTVREASNAIQGALNGDKRDNPDCYHVRPSGGPDGLAFMVSSGRIARISISNPKIQTVEGARAGDTESHIKSLYRNQIKISNHPYEEGGHYLTVIPRNPKFSHFRIVFETDGKRVTNYRVGKIPEVEYIEGCS